jgi:hypothetical protein
MSLMMTPMNPGMYTGWMNQSMSPATYGAMGTWMNPATYAAPMSGAAVPMTGSFNFFDPNAWMGMMAPVAPQAAPAPAAPAPAK